MHKVIRTVAAALTVICLSLMAAMPMVAGWRTPAEQVLPPPPINPLELMQQAKDLQVLQVVDFSMTY